MNDGSGSLEGIIAPCLSSGVCNARLHWEPLWGKELQEAAAIPSGVPNNQPTVEWTERTGLGETRWFAVTGRGSWDGRQEGMFWELNRNSWCMSIFFSVEILTSVSISVGLVCTCITVVDPFCTCMGR